MFKVLALAFLPLIPMIIESVYFVLYGNAAWSSIWGNEVRVWGVILSPFSLLGIFLALGHAYKWLFVLPAFTFVVVVLNLVIFGVEPVPIMDQEELKLLDFWFEQWQYWEL